MKRTILAVAAGAFLMTSCGGINVDEAVDEFCACSEKSGDEKSTCVDEWVEKYKGSRGSEEDDKKLIEGMAECDPFTALDASSRMQE